MFRRKDEHLYNDRCPNKICPGRMQYLYLYNRFACDLCTGKSGFEVLSKFAQRGPKEKEQVDRIIEEIKKDLESGGSDV